MEPDELIVLLAEAQGAERRITVRGELDIDSSPRLQAAIHEAIEAGTTLLLLDLTAVSFVDSSALRTLVQAAGDLDDRGGHLVLEGVSPAVQRLLEITGLIERFRAATDADTDD